MNLEVFTVSKHFWVVNLELAQALCGMRLVGFRNNLDDAQSFSNSFLIPTTTNRNVPDGYIGWMPLYAQVL